VASTTATLDRLVNVAQLPAAQIEVAADFLFSSHFPPPRAASTPRGTSEVRATREKTLATPKGHVARTGAP
jgi:hypothetical protein